MTSIVTILQNFVKLACLEVAFLKIGFFGIWVCNLQTSQIMSIFFCFRASLLSMTSSKNCMVIRAVVSETLGGLVVPTPDKKSKCLQPLKSSIPSPSSPQLSFDLALNSPDICLSRQLSGILGDGK